jgi:hypothetical protein
MVSTESREKRRESETRKGGKEDTAMTGRGLIVGTEERRVTITVIIITKTVFSRNAHLLDHVYRQRHCTEAGAVNMPTFITIIARSLQDECA